MKDSPLILVLVIGLLGFIGFNWWQKQSTQTSALAKAEESEDKIATLEKTIKTLGDQLSDLAGEQEEG